MQRVGHKVKTFLGWLLSGTFLILFLIPVALSILSMMNVSKQDVFRIMMGLATPVGSASFTVQSHGTNSDLYLNSSVLQEFFEPATMTDLRRNIYTLAKQAVDSFHSISFGQDDKWRHVKFGADYHVEIASVTALPVERQNRSVFFAHRCRMNVTTSLSKQDILRFLAAEGNSNVFFATKDMAYKDYSPVYSFEWYNGSLDVIHLPILALDNAKWRKELVAVRAVDNKRSSIVWRSLTPPGLSRRDLQLIEAQHYNLRQETHPISFHPAAHKMLQAFVGVHVRSLTKDDKRKGAKESRSPGDAPDGAAAARRFEITVFRFSSNLHMFPWLDWYANSYLYFPTVFSRLKNMLSNEELAKQVQQQFQQRQQQT